MIDAGAPHRFVDFIGNAGAHANDQRCRDLAFVPVSAPLVRGEVVTNPETVASAIRIGNPASWGLALEARQATDGYFGAIDDQRILAAQKLLAGEVGIFVEPASAISVAGLLARVEAGVVPQGARVVLTVTGHGLKDPQWALRNADGSQVEPTVVDATTSEVASVLHLAPAAATA